MSQYHFYHKTITKYGRLSLRPGNAMSDFKMVFTGISAPSVCKLSNDAKFMISYKLCDRQQISQ